MKKLNLTEGTIFRDDTENWKVIWIMICAITGGYVIGKKFGEGLFTIFGNVYDKIQAKKLKKKLQKEAEENKEK